jgi:hypothetical protein
MKTGDTDQALAELTVSLREDGRLSIVEGDEEHETLAQIICSLGLTDGVHNAH